MNKNEMLVSIIMPAYNCEKYISEAIYSVITQTYENWELLIIDDGSTDNTSNIIKSFCQNDNRVKAFPNDENIGVSATRNKGIELSSGNWIAFLDSDDVWEPEKLEKQLETANDKNADFLFTGSSYINEVGKPYEGIFNVPERVTYELLRNHNVISCSSVLVKKEYFKNIKMENDDMHEDYAVWLRILKLGTTAIGINEPLLVYRISKTSKSGNKFKTIKMTYKVFRFVGINPIGSAYFTIRHIVASVRKYKLIFRK